ncbi:hypothetical protein DFQ01_12498 [Paenibacillus cellulosilyticus]|uniref:Uncharacterized protein n=1 Tax=Paenibacillus cellulosilyticus TaxID=375489 RepID=A0A2V2YP94_9BACL|nr:hypothetical protein DFQ01_12498 [Paenibacillus cellulosilyticus]
MKNKEPCIMLLTEHHQNLFPFVLTTISFWHKSLPLTQNTPYRFHRFTLKSAFPMSTIRGAYMLFSYTLLFFNAAKRYACNNITGQQEVDHEQR